MHPDHPMRHGCPPDWADGFGCDEYGPYAEVYIDDATLRMRWIPPGTFKMGSPESEEGRFDREVQHEVTISQGYWLADAPLTQRLWQTVTGENPSHFKGPDRPVETVTWDDVQAFIERLNARNPAFEARLPTEAEWEYACRAGTTTARYGELDEVAWYTKNSGGETHPVRQKQPNAWGLYDMLGHVWEWCADWWQRNYDSGAVTNPTGPEEGSYRVNRGGSWDHSARGVRAAFRYWDPPGYRVGGLGFRLSRGPAPSARSAEPPRSGSGGAESRGERPWSRAEGSRVSGGAAVPEADPGSGGRVGAGPGHLLWFKDGDEQYRTVYLHAGRTANIDRVVTATSDAAWLLEMVQEDYGERETHWGVTVEQKRKMWGLAPYAKGLSIGLHTAEVTEAKGDRGEAEDSCDLQVLAVLGPYLFMRFSTGWPSNHKRWRVDYKVVDLREPGKRVVRELLSSGPAREEWLPRAIAAAQQADNEPQGSTFEWIEHKAVLPRFDADGRLRVLRQYTHWTIGAASDPWEDDETDSVLIETAVPQMLQPWAAAPVAVQEYLKHRSDGFLGWAEVPSEHPGLALAFNFNDD